MAKALEILYPNITAHWDDPKAIRIAHILNKAIEVYFTEDGKLLPFEVRQKSVGVNNGFVISGPNNSQPKFIKTFLDPQIGAKPSSIELLTYRLLEESKFGAKVEAHSCCDGEIAFLVSHDIKELGQAFIGEEAIKFAQDNHDNQQFKEQIIALEIFAKILNLGDVRSNLGNFGVVVDKAGRLIPIILDFHFDPQYTDFPLSASATRITFPKMAEKFDEVSETPCATFGLTRSFKQTGLTREVYTNAVKSLPLDMLDTAIANGKEYCRQFSLQIGNSKLAPHFNPDALEEYCTRVTQHYHKLNNFDEFEKESVNVMNHVMPELAAKSATVTSPKSATNLNICGSPPAWTRSSFFI